MTELQRRYTELREAGATHTSAIAALEHQTGIDRTTIKRTLQRAEKNEGRLAAPLA